MQPLLFQDVPTCEEPGMPGQCMAMIVNENGQTMLLRLCPGGGKFKAVHEAKEGAELWAAVCDTDLCNNWDAAGIKAKASTSSISYLIAITIVVAKFIAMH
ncbi:unnamed protein product, partial [Mesorhabditis spiculigera]